MSRVTLEDNRINNPSITGIMCRCRLGPPIALATAGAGTYTAAQMVNGRLLRDPAGANRADALPTAALLVAEIAKVRQPFVGMEIEVDVHNTADAAETITLSAGTGGTVGNTGVTTAFGQNTSKRLIFRLDNVTSGSEAYTVYSL